MSKKTKVVKKARPKPRSRRSRPPAASADHKRDDARIMAALCKRQHRTFASFVAQHSGATLAEMAKSLGVPKGVFVGYHARWVTTNASIPYQA